MTNASPISHANKTQVSRLNGAKATLNHTTDTLRQGVARPSDQLDLSDRALLLSRLRDLPSVRADLVQRVKGEIDSGAYDSADKLDAAVTALADEFASTG